MPRLASISGQNFLGIIGGKRFNPSLLHTLNNPGSFSDDINDYFGTDLTMNDDYLLVSASGEDILGGSNAGRVYAFSPSTGELVHDLYNPNAYGGGFGDNFGGTLSPYHSMDIKGNYAAIGAPGEDSGGTNSGHMYVFDLSDSNPNLNNRLDIGNPNAEGFRTDDYFGRTVAISENYILGTSAREENGGLVNSGYAYVFRKSDGVLLHSIINPNDDSASVQDFFGDDAAMNDNYLAIGANGENDSDGAGTQYSASGKIYVYSPSSASLLRTIRNPVPDDYARFGNYMAMHNNYLIAGVPLYDSDENNTGRAYVFDVATGELISTLKNPNLYALETNDQFGQAVDISDKYAIVGVPFEDNTVSATGVAYMFDIFTGELVHTFDNPNPTLDDEFGASVAISENYVAIGVPRDDDSGVVNTGRTYVYSIYE
jgi:hypothetical protein